MGEKKKKGNGQGTVYVNGKKFRAQVTLADGKRKSKTFETKREANTWIREMLHDKDVGGPLSRKWNPEGYTVQSWIEKRLNEKISGLDKNPISEQTYITYHSYVSAHIYPQIGDIPLHELTKEDIEKMYVVECSDMAQGTIELIKIIFKDALKVAVKRGIIPNNPHEDVAPSFGKKQKKVEAFTREEQQKIINYLLSSDDFRDPVFYFLISTGVRVGEATALSWSDVDFSKNIIHVRKTVAHVKDGYIIKDQTKTESGMRDIPISSKLAKWLKSHKKKLDSKKNVQDLVFPNMRYSSFAPPSLTKRWQTILRVELQIPYKSIHALRHTYATRCLEEGIPVNTVSKLLGHSKPSITMDIYQSVLPDLKKQAIEKIEHLF